MLIGFTATGLLNDILLFENSFHLNTSHLHTTMAFLIATRLIIQIFLLEYATNELFHKHMWICK